MGRAALRAGVYQIELRRLPLDSVDIHLELESSVNTLAPVDRGNLLGAYTCAPASG